jgi:murein DD-endopeptidase MepM/ murein hydrolase activator NlpD
LRGGEKLALQPRIEYVVQSGDNIHLIALSQDVSPSALIQLNGLSAPYQLTPGQTLILPSDRDVPQSAPPPAPSAPGEIAAGSLAPIAGTASDSAGQPTANSAAGAKAFEPEPVASTGPVDLQASGAPAQATQAGVSTGTLSPLPVPSDSQQQANVEPAGATPEAVEPVAPPPPSPVAVPEPPAPAAQPEAPVPAIQPESTTPATSATAGGFIWPVEGKVVSRFGTAADGLRNDGINIAAPEGAPVKAAADGVVAYAGNELRGFGNMILIKHADNWVTAYAHNSGLLVKKGDQVKQGQVIARVGSSGNVANPQLHFEIRNGTRAVDPAEKLGG